MRNGCNFPKVSWSPLADLTDGAGSERAPCHKGHTPRIVPDIGFDARCLEAGGREFGDHVRFSWGLGPEGADSPIKGTDFAVVRDGRIRSITGFLDQVPAGA